MPIIKTTWFFQMRKSGWSESFVQNLLFGDNDFDLVMNIALEQAQLRAAWLGKQASIVGVRCAKVAPDKGGFLRQIQIAGNQDNECDEQDAALDTTFYDSTKTKKKQHFGRGIWDDVDVQGGQVNVAPPGFLAAYNAWVAGLQQRGYGWLTVGPKNTGLVKTLVVNPSFNVTITFTKPIFLVGDVGNIKVGRVSGVNGKSPLNGPQTFIVEALDKVTTVKPIALFPYLSGGKVVFADKTVIGIAKFIPNKISTRKAGRVFFSTPGRRPARARG